VLGRYSKHWSQIQVVQKLLTMTPNGCPVASVLSRQTQHRLSKSEIEQLVIIYQSGRTITDLVDDFQVNRTTVMAHLRRAGVPRRESKISDTQLREVVECYLAGQTLVQVGDRFGVDGETIRRALLKAGVVRRSAGKRLRMKH